MSQTAVFLFIALPWLNPWSLGPTPSVLPLLFSWGCAAALWGAASKPLRWVTPQQLVRLTAAAWLAAALISSAMGLIQYFGATGPFYPWINSTGMGEAFANLRQRNQFATLTSIGFATLLWWVGRTASPPSRGISAAHLLAALLLAAGNAASSSRTGLLQWAGLLALALWWGGARQPALRRVLVVALLAYVVAALSLPYLAGLDPHSTGMLARLHDGDASGASRLTLWANVLHLIALKPWFGWGWGELKYAHFMTLYPGQRFSELLDNAHNLPLQLAVELGLPVALAVCGGGALAAWRAKPWRERNATRQLAWAVIAVIMLHSLLEYPLWYGPFQMAMGLSLWLLWRQPPPDADDFKINQAAGPVQHA